MNAAPPPGWYPDNEGAGQRYWDGQRWTEHTAPVGIEPPQGSLPSAGALHVGAGRGNAPENWLLRHKILSGAVAFVVLAMLVGSFGGDGGDTAPAAADASSGSVADGGPEMSAEAEVVAEDEPEPVDTDGDGVVDEDDVDPDNPKVRTQDDVDSDKDGVPDYQDDFPKDAKYSRDADGDSVADQLDDFPKDDRYSQDSDGDAVADSEDAFPQDPTRAKITLAMDNALAAAEDYLRFSAFSRQGLIDQMSSNYGSGFRVEDATWAVDQLDVDWRQQAVRAAKEYLEFSPFSRDGLIGQLSSSYGSQFTVEEATYAVSKIGL